MYQRAIGVGSTPFERLTTAFLGALRIGRQGFKAAEAGRVKDAASKGERLQAIVHRMDQSLDFSVAPELCKNLNRLYTHVMTVLDDPDLGSKPEVFAECIQILSTLWEGFQEAEEQGKS
jgi:flagellar protein FliS